MHRVGALAAALASQTLHFAWGTGDAAWDTAPVPEPIDATALVNEVGRRLVTQVQFVTAHSVAAAVVHALTEDVAGVYNFAPVDAMKVLDGTQSHSTQAPPIPSRSTTVTSVASVP